MSYNLILTGPPGCGKTYAARKRAVQIFFPSITDDTVINSAFKVLTYIGAIKFVTFHQAFGYEDFIEGLKPSVGTNGITYSVKDGVFKELCSANPKIWVTGAKPCTNIQPNDIVIKFVNNKFEVTIPATNEDSTTEKTFEISGDLFTKITGIINASGITNCQEINISQKVLIIDEINRGNVAAIFGDTLPLIEDKKRIGNAEALQVTLPLSRSLFDVPNNLYIIGTMNTADRSVEPLDIALRRRFKFEEIRPNPSLLTTPIHGINLNKLLTQINLRIEKLLDADHAIGHSYFMGLTKVEDLKEVFYNNIIPLLMEYFYNQPQKVAMVIGSSFFEEKEVELAKIGNMTSDDDDIDTDKKVFRLKELTDDNVFINAIQAIYAENNDK